jgi:outer membrane autotransporter protein
MTNYLNIFAQSQKSTSVLRGGRLIKWKGKVASLSPSLEQLVTSVSPVALMQALSIGTKKAAGAAALSSAGLIVITSVANAACVEGPEAIYVCSTDETTTQSLTGGDQEILDVSLGSGLTFDTTNSTGAAFDLQAEGGIRFTNNYADTSISGKTVGLYLFMDSPQEGNSGAITITTAGDVNGSDAGIRAQNNGSGALSITSTGQVTAISEIGSRGTGIDAYNSSSGTDLTITTTAEVKGRGTGIQAQNNGSDALSITSTGQVTGEIHEGIDAYNSSSGTDLTITTTAEVKGRGAGIQAQNNGSGALSITSTGQVTGDDNGIDADNSSSGTDLTISSAAVTGYYYGIRAQNNGSGALSITSTGQVTSTNNYMEGAGIDADNSSSGTDLTISSAAVTSFYYGIQAQNNGSGALSITSTGQVTGDGDIGIDADNSSSGTDLTISSAAVTGGYHGIDASNSGSGTTTITTAGEIRGGTGAGISTDGPAGATVRVALNDGSDVSATSGSAIVDTDADASVTVNTGASVTGSIALGDGDDTLTFAGGGFSGVTRFDGGDSASDVISFAGSSGALDSTMLFNWERVEINAGSTMSFSNNSLAVSNLNIGTGGVFDAMSGTFTLTGNLTNRGTLNLADNYANDVVNVSGNFTGGGQINMDVNTATQTSDSLNITGNASGTTQIAFTNTTPTIESDNIIANVVTVQGTSSATNFSGSVVGGIYTYNLEYNVGNFDLVGTMNSTSAAYKIAPTILGGFNQMSSLNQRMCQRQFGSVDVPTCLSFSDLDLVEQQMPNLWLNIGGTRAQRVTSAGTDLEYTNRNIAIGVDFDLESGASGRWVVGTHAQYGAQNGSVTDETGVSVASTTGIGAGINATWFGNLGTYVDTQAQITQLKTEMSSDAGGLLIEDASSKAYALSMEVGHRIELNGQSALTPQAQLTLGRVDGANFTDTAGTLVDLGTSLTKAGRIGLAYEYQADQSTFYSTGSIIRDFGSPTTVEAAGESFSEDTNITWGEIGVGGLYWMNDTSRLYGEVVYRQALNISSSNVLSAKLGMQIQW